MESKRDYYEVLEVPRDADAATLKKAFRKLALQYHPDKNPGDATAEARFKEASEAYDVLSNPEKRAHYDRFGHEGMRGQGFDPGFQNVGDIFTHFGDIFGDIFGGGGGRRGGRPGMQRGSDLEVGLRLEFMEAVNGCQKEVEVGRHNPCGGCEGRGRTGTKVVSCPTCGGRGEVIQQQMFLRIRTVCPACRGQGKTVGDPCTDCGGRGRVRVSDKLVVTVPPGVDTGNQLRLTGKGDLGDPGAPPGDLYVTIGVGEHEFFKRDGLDVYCSVPVSYPQACLGATLKVPTVRGEESLEIPRGTASGKVFTLRGKGISGVNGRGQGNQHIQVVVDVPKKLSPREEELIRELAQLQDGKVGEKGFWRDFLDRISL